MLIASGQPILHHYLTHSRALSSYSTVIQLYSRPNQPDSPPFLTGFTRPWCCFGCHWLETDSYHLLLTAQFSSLYPTSDNSVRNLLSTTLKSFTTQISCFPTRIYQVPDFFLHTLSSHGDDTRLHHPTPIQRMGFSLRMANDRRHSTIAPSSCRPYLGHSTFHPILVLQNNIALPWVRKCCLLNILCYPGLRMHHEALLCFQLYLDEDEEKRIVR